MTRRSIALATAALMLGTAAPGAAQSNDPAEAARRIDRLERELRAVQRRVFPGAEGGLVMPDNGPQPVAPVASSGTGGGAGTDLAPRLDAIEATLARLTGEVEQVAFRQREQQSAIDRLRDQANAAATTNAITPAPNSTSVPSPAPIRPVTPAPAPSTLAAAPSPRPAGAVTPASASTQGAAASAARRARVAAIEVPATGNAPEDSYLYGFRLWEAQLYPEAQAQLQQVLTRYPTHRRASYAGNLLGRAYLDNNQPTLAVRALYDNFRERPRGERAADSLYYMGLALIRLDRRQDACRTFTEFDSNFGTSATAALKAQVATARGQAGC